MEDYDPCQTPVPPEDGTTPLVSPRGVVIPTILIDEHIDESIGDERWADVEQEALVEVRTAMLKQEES